MTDRTTTQRGPTWPIASAGKGFTGVTIRSNVADPSGEATIDFMRHRPILGTSHWKEQELVVLTFEEGVRAITADATASCERTP